MFSIALTEDGMNGWRDLDLGLLAEDDHAREVIRALLRFDGGVNVGDHRVAPVRGRGDALGSIENEDRREPIVALHGLNLCQRENDERYDQRAKRDRDGATDLAEASEALDAHEHQRRHHKRKRHEPPPIPHRHREVAHHRLDTPHLRSDTKPLDAMIQRIDHRYRALAVHRQGPRIVQLARPAPVTAPDSD